MVEVEERERKKVNIGEEVKFARAKLESLLFTENPTSSVVWSFPFSSIRVLTVWLEPKTDQIVNSLLSLQSHTVHV